MKKLSRYGQLFWLFLTLHTFLWTVTPVFIRHALSDDLIEAFIWGQQFVWGYDKNPWLPGTLAHIGILLGGRSGIGIYFIQSLFIALGLFSVWRLMSKISNPIYALISVMMYEACACYSVDLQIYNDNYILMGLLPLATLFFYRAIRKEKLSDWLLAAAITALAVMGKYDAILFAISIFCYLMTTKKRWHYLASYKTWSALSIFILLIAPNLLWLSHHHFSTLSYAFHERADFGNQSWFYQTKNNLYFVWITLLGFLPALVLASLVLTQQRENLLVEKTNHTYRTHENLNFLFWSGFGPIILLTLLGFLMGLTLHREWGNAFISLWGAFILLRLKPSISKDSLKRFIIATFVMLFVWPTGYLYIASLKDTGVFPAPEIARYATTVWHKHFHTRLRYVAGDRYTAGYVALHSHDHPAVWMEWNTQAATWIHEKDLKCHGALFIQDSGHTHQHFYQGTTFPRKVLNHHPKLKILRIKEFAWHRNHQKKPNLKLLIGLLPPDATQCS
ncbi:MAG: glycosyltransferase family 39 protein [Gammaproteobacteria bacterium]|nr:glycosyltransferase family 39 protein [Gammaproteobacteria bacterium]